MGLAEKYLVRSTIEDWKHWQGDWELVGGIPYAIALPRPINKITLIKLRHLLYSTLGNCENCKVSGELDRYITVIRKGKKSATDGY